jgi:outer membrane protein assembly factor BamB
VRCITVALAVALACSACGGASTQPPTPPPAATALATTATVAADIGVLVTVDMASGAIIAEQPTSGTDLAAVRAGEAILMEGTEDESLLAGPTVVVPLAPASTADAPVVLIDGTGQVVRFDASGRRTLAPAGSAAWPGVAPVAHGVALVVGTETTGTSTVGIDAVSGRTVWRAPARGIGPPASDGEIVVTIASEFTANHTSVVGLDARTGAERWRTSVPFGYAVFPSVVGGRVFVSGREGDALTSRAALLDAGTGTILWSIDLAGTTVDGGPVLIGDVLWMAGTRDDSQSLIGHAVARSVRDGRVLHDIPVAYSSFEPPAASTDAVALPLDDGLVLLDAATGEQRWRLPGSYGGPIIAGDRLYAVRTTG